MLITIIKHLQAILLLPTTVTVVVPIIILFRAKTANPGWSLSFPFDLVLKIFGLTFVGCGLALMIKTIALFAKIGRGTLAPWTPTQRLVVRGVYRHVRNPMISGVCAVLLGEALFFGAPGLLKWFMIFVMINVIYIPLFEEPGLEKRFGHSYLDYKKNVPRWLPRRRPWIAPGPE